MASVFKRGGKSNRHGYWYASWWEFEGGRQRRRTKCTRTTDKAAAERIAHKHEADTALRREGVINPMLDAIGKESQRTIESHLVDFESKLTAGGLTDQYVKQTAKYIRRIAQASGFNAAADIESDAVNRFVNALKEANKSARTIQAHLTAIMGFTKWLTKNHKLPLDPLTSIVKPDPKADRRRERRMLLPDEWKKLADATAAAPDRYGMTADERMLLYRTAIETGLRSNEFRGLTRMSLVFDIESPYIRARASTTKNGKEAQQFIQQDLAELLRKHVSKKTPTAHIFNLPDPSDMATMLREDLASARKTWLRECWSDLDAYYSREQSDFLAERNHDGKLLDFHSLRHTCGAWLAKTGAHPKVIQQVMRHSSITLTMDTYGHLFPGQEAEAVRQLECFTGRKSESLAATGTDDATRNARSAGRSSCDTKRRIDDTAPYDENAGPATLPLVGNPIAATALCSLVPSVTMPYDPIAPLAQLAEQLTLNQ